MNCWTDSWLLGTIMLLLQVSKGSIFSRELLICLVSWGMRGSTSMFSKFIFLIPTWLPVHPIVILACHGFLVSLSCQNRLSSGWYAYLCTIELCFYNFTSIGNPQLFPAAKIVLECIALVFVCLYHWLCSKVTFCVAFHNSFVYHIGRLGGAHEGGTTSPMPWRTRGVAAHAPQFAGKGLGTRISGIPPLAASPTRAHTRLLSLAWLIWSQRTAAVPGTAHFQGRCTAAAISTLS
jgi:hypothetical protein